MKMTLLKESYKEDLEKLYEELKVDRDQTKLKLHLAKLEIQEKWEKTEHKLQNFQSKFKAIEKSVGDAGGDIGNGLVVLGKEIKHAYQDIKKGINTSKLTK
jgi:hypothetical protein